MYVQKMLGSGLQRFIEMMSWGGGDDDDNGLVNKMDILIGIR